MKGIIKAKKEIARGALLVTFDLLGKNVNFKPGQFLFITIPKLIYPDSKGNMRHFSIVNSPNEKGIITMATRMREGSGFKKTLQELPVGSEVIIGNALGNFILPKEYANPLVFIAGGIGITPFISMLTYASEESSPYDVTLIYSNKDEGSTAFLADLERLADQNKRLKLILTMTQDAKWKGERGRIDAGFIQQHVLDLDQKTFYVAGPPAFNDAVLKSLKELEIKNKNIIFENFFGY